MRGGGMSGVLGIEAREGGVWGIEAREGACLSDRPRGSADQ